MHTQITKLSAWLALFVVSGYVVCPTYVRAELGTTAAPATKIGTGTGMVAKPNFIEYATATVVRGTVKKALPSGQDGMGIASSCAVGDMLPDGTVVQTGKEDESMAELKWGGKGHDGKVTRLWKNSLVRIFCGQRGKMDTVCVAKGGVIFRKDPKDLNFYWVETKLLQARVHGTTVRVLSEPPSSTQPGLDKLLVLEGHSIQVKNKETGSIVELTPGVELVVQVRASYKCNDKRFEFNPPLGSAAQDNNIASNAADYRLHPEKGELLFEDRTSLVKAYTVNAKAILEDPMVRGTSEYGPIESIDLIQTTMKDFPSSDRVLENMIGDAINFGKPDKYLSNSKILRIAKVPETSAYTIGRNVGEQGEGRAITLPMTDHHPAARLEFDVASHVANVKPLTASVPRPMGIIPITTTPDVDEQPDQMALKHSADNNDNKTN